MFVFVVLCLAGDYHQLVKQRWQEPADIAAKEILTYVFLLVYSDPGEEFQKQIALDNIVDVYNKLGTSNNYFQSKKLSHRMMKQIHLMQAERLFLAAEMNIERRKQFEEDVLSGDIKVAKEYYSNQTYALAKIGSVYARHGLLEEAKVYAGASYENLASETDVRLVKNCLVLITDTYIEAGDYDKALGLLGYDLKEEEDLKYQLVDRLVDEQRFDEAFKVVQMVASDRGRQIETLINIAFGYGDSSLILKEDNRAILQRIVLSVLDKNVN